MSVAKTPISITAVQGTLKQIAKRIQVGKKVSIHTLRHSYATHLLEAGVSLRSKKTISGQEFVWLFLGWTYWLGSGHTPPDESTAHSTLAPMSALPSTRDRRLSHPQFQYTLLEHVLNYLDNG